MTRKPKAPTARTKTTVSKAGAKREAPDASLLPLEEGETVRIAFRADSRTVDEINAELDRLADLVPGMVITVSDAVRNLIHAGADHNRENNT